MIFRSINPYTNELLAEYEGFSNAMLDEKLMASSRAYRHWKQQSFDHRAALLLEVRANLLRNLDKYAALITAEMGKHIREARAEVEKSALVCEYYALNAAEHLRPIKGETPHESWVLFEPIGAVLGIMPWNFPVWQVMRFATAALMAGNVVLLKHAPNVMGSALALENLFLEAGFPEGVFQSLLIDTEQVERVIAHQNVQAVMLTGSDRAGSAVAALAGKHIKRSIMELGGSDPILILDDAPLEQAAAIAVQSRMGNAGQVCIAAKRWLVTPKNAEAFEHLVQQHILAIKQGNPLDDAVQMGPMARPDLVTNLKRQIETSIAQGASLKTPFVVDGNNVQPCLLGNISDKMPVFCEEVFGPAASIYVVKNEAEMLAVANQSDYGLAASVWTADQDKARALASQLEVGSVYVNALVRSDPKMPIGGVKRSGYGRELSAFGIRELTNIKTLIVK